MNFENAGEMRVRAFSDRAVDAMSLAAAAQAAPAAAASRGPLLSARNIVIRFGGIVALDGSRSISNRGVSSD